jgi:FkbH-like protein
MRNCNCRGAPHPPRRGIMRTVPHQGGSDAQLPLRAQAEPILNGAAVQVAVDCDYTLWREAVGEVGPGGVVFEHHHLKLQALLARLAEAGTLICLLSRNDPADVRATLALRAAEMLLQDKHIAAWAVDPLASKVHGLRALAQQLRLPTDAFALVDDNPTECMAVRLALPKVPAVQLGPAPAAFEAALARAWVLDEPRRVLTSEDRERARRYREDVARRSSGAFEHGQRPAATLFAALQITVRIWRVQAGCEGGGAQECEVRVAQLSERANQFNACKRILSATEVSAFRQRPGSVLLMASAGDRFGDLGQVGAVLLVREPETKRNGSNSVRVVVEAFIMSCRALGRGVEHAMLARAGEEALALSRVFPESDSQCEVLVRWEERERNAPVRAFLRWAARQTGGSEGHDGVRLQAASMAQLVFDPSALLQEDTANLAEQKIGDDRSGSDTATVDAGAEVGSENEQQEETSGQAFADIMWEVRTEHATCESLTVTIRSILIENNIPNQVTNGEMCNAYGLLERVRKEQRGKKRISKVRAAAGSKEEDEALLSWYQQRRPKQERLWAEQLQKIASEVRIRHPRKVAQLSFTSVLQGEK